MRKVILPLAFLAWLLAGCWMVSISPLYTENDIVFEPLLIGRWGDPEDDRSDVWIFEAAGDEVYMLTLKQEDQGDALFEAHLLRLGDHLFLDLFPKPSEEDNDIYESHLVPAHSFWRVELSEESLRLAMMDREWFNIEIREGRLKLPHEAREDVLILTAPTPDLQSFVLAHLEECFEWGNPFVHVE